MASTGFATALENLTQYKEQWIEKGVNLLPNLVIGIVILGIGWLFIKLIDKGVRKVFDRTPFDETVERFLHKVIMVLLWAILIIVVLSNFGVNVSALVAGLGIAGFIVGFALQNTLGNLASGLFLLINKPFREGDSVKIGDIVGDVKEMGIAACIIHTPDNTKVTIPNSKIWGDAIYNYTGNPTRKLFNLKVGISYSDDIGKAISTINDILKKDERVLKDPEPQIVVSELADSSVNISIRPTVKKGDYWPVYFDAIRKIKEEFDRKGITIPFPQRDVHMKK